MLTLILGLYYILFCTFCLAYVSIVIQDPLCEILVTIYWQLHLIFLLDSSNLVKNSPNSSKSKLGFLIYFAEILSDRMYLGHFKMIKYLIKLRIEALKFQFFHNRQ